MSEPGSTQRWTGEPYASALVPLLYVLLPVITVAPSLGRLGTLGRIVVGALAVIAVLVRPARLLPVHVAAAGVFVAVAVAHGLGVGDVTYGTVRTANMIMFIPLIALPLARPVLRALFLSLWIACWLQVVGVLLQVRGVWGGTWGGLVISGTSADPSSLRWLKRYTGFLQNPNDLGLVLAVGVIACVGALALAKLRSRQRVVLLISAGAFGAGIVGSGSRGALLAVVLGVVVVTMYLATRHRLRVALGLAVGAVLALQSYAFPFIAASFADFVGGTDTSASQRQRLWQNQLQTNDAWFIGNGFGGYLEHPTPSASGAGLLDDAVQRSATIDNAWLKLLLEMGLLGVTALAVTLVVLSWGALRGRSAPDRGLRAVVLGTSVALLSRSLSADIFDVNPWNVVAWLLAGLAVGIGRRDRRVTAVQGSRGVTVRNRWSLAAADGRP